MQTLKIAIQIYKAQLLHTKLSLFRIQIDVIPSNIPTKNTVDPFVHHYKQ
jgi:hypothetical protein